MGGDTLRATWATSLSCPASSPSFLPSFLQQPFLQAPATKWQLSYQHLPGPCPTWTIPESMYILPPLESLLPGILSPCEKSKQHHMQMESLPIGSRDLTQGTVTHAVCTSPMCVWFSFGAWLLFFPYCLLGSDNHYIQDSDLWAHL